MIINKNNNNINNNNNKNRFGLGMANLDFNRNLRGPGARIDLRFFQDLCLFRSGMLHASKTSAMFRSLSFGRFRPPGPLTSSPPCDFTSIGGRRAPEDDI